MQGLHPTPSRPEQQKLRFPGEREMHSQDCSTQILPEFEACQLVLLISDLPVYASCELMPCKWAWMHLTHPYLPVISTYHWLSTCIYHLSFSSNACIIYLSITCQSYLSIIYLLPSQLSILLVLSFWKILTNTVKAKTHTRTKITDCLYVKLVSLMLILFPLPLGYNTPGFYLGKFSVFFFFFPIPPSLCSLSSIFITLDFSWSASFLNFALVLLGALDYFSKFVQMHTPSKFNVWLRQRRLRNRTPLQESLFASHCIMSVKKHCSLWSKRWTGFCCLGKNHAQYSETNDLCN